MHASYAPISCSFHDGLEALATTRKQASIAFRTQSGETQIRDAAIVDLFSRDGAEYVVLSTGETIRLDRLLAVDGVALDLAEPPLQE
jgi:Rho-binding antiterminator